MGSRRAAESGAGGVGLLVSLLLHHPEIGTLRFDPRHQRLRFRFLVTRQVSDAEFTGLRRRLSDALEVYYRLVGQPAGVCRLTRHLYGEVTDLEISRDVASLSAGEVGLIIALVQEACGDHLVTDAEGEAPPIEGRSELIGELLAGLRQKPAASPLIALREEGRVLVFHK